MYKKVYCRKHILIKSSHNLGKITLPLSRLIASVMRSATDFSSSALELIPVTHVNPEGKGRTRGSSPEKTTWTGGLNTRVKETRLPHETVNPEGKGGTRGDQAAS